MYIYIYIYVIYIYIFIYIYIYIYIYNCELNEVLSGLNEVLSGMNDVLSEPNEMLSELNQVLSEMNGGLSEMKEVYNNRYIHVFFRGFRDRRTSSIASTQRSNLLSDIPTLHTQRFYFSSDASKSLLNMLVKPKNFASAGASAHCLRRIGERVARMCLPIRSTR